MEYRLAGETRITISFYNNRVAGGSGVNYYTGTYEIAGFFNLLVFSATSG